MKPLPDPESVRRVVVRLTNWVGDAVMNTPFLARTRRTFPNARIAVLGRASVASLFTHHPDVDEVWTLDDRSRAGYREAIGRLRRFRADVAFALPNSLNSAALLRLGGARVRVGYARDRRGVLLTHAIELRPQDLAVHEVKYYLRLLSPWGASGGDPGPLKLEVTAEERVAFDRWLKERGIGLETPLIGVNPAAFFGTAKRWLPERYAESAAQLARESGARVLVTGLPGEREWAQRVCDHGGAAFHNAAGEMKLRDLMTFLDRCRLYLTNDSGAMHIAAALGAPLVAVFGSTDWVTTAPLSPKARIVRVPTECAPCILRDCPIDHRCMTGVSVRAVVKAGRELLGSTG
ncbi:MAG: lipopolysaccharide heptosyltransferase II [Sumerlaeia bacterium]